MTATLPAWVITDHRYRPQTVGRWRLPVCDYCGEPSSHHLSVAEGIAAKIGGPARVYLSGPDGARVA